MYINPLGTEISQNHLSILKWSLNKYWGWKVWTLSFQMPCRTHFSESWMQRSIISNEKVSYLYLGVLPENMWMSFLHSTSRYSLTAVFFLEWIILFALLRNSLRVEKIKKLRTFWLIFANLRVFDKLSKIKNFDQLVPQLLVTFWSS